MQYPTVEYDFRRVRPPDLNYKQKNGYKTSNRKRTHGIDKIIGENIARPHQLILEPRKREVALSTAGAGNCSVYNWLLVFYLQYGKKAKLKIL